MHEKWNAHACKVKTWNIMTTKYYWKTIIWNLTIGWDTHTHVQKPWITTWMYWLPTITFQLILLVFTNGWGFMLNINQHTVVFLLFWHKLNLFLFCQTFEKLFICAKKILWIYPEFMASSHVYLCTLIFFGYKMTHC